MFEGEDIDADLTGDESDVLPCPSCGQPVFEEAQKCPHCGEWIMPLAASAAKPIWVRVVGAIVAVALALALLRGLWYLLS